MDVFHEVQRIENEAERLLADASAEAAKAAGTAKSEAEAYRAESEAKLAAETTRLKAEQQQKIAKGLAAVEADFKARKEVVAQAARNTDALASWVAEKYLADNAK